MATYPRRIWCGARLHSPPLTRSMQPAVLNEFTELLQPAFAADGASEYPGVLMCEARV